MNIDRLGRIDLSVTKHVETVKGHRLSMGDILFNNTNSPALVGKTAYFDRIGDYAFSNHMTRLRPPTGVDAKLLAIQLHRQWDLGVFRRLCSNHVNQASVSASRLLEAVTVRLPPANEQRRIVAAIEEQFSRLDAAERSIAAVARRLDSLLALFIGTAAQGGWSRVSLGAVTEHQAYGTSAKANDDPTGVPVLRMGNIQSGSIDTTVLKYLPRDHPDVTKFALAPGDLLFNRTNSAELVGKSAVFKDGSTPTIFASYLIRTRLNADCLPEWAALVINGPIGRSYVASVRTQQVGQANVNGTKLAAMEIPLPPVGEQRRIIAEVERRLSVIAAMREAIDSAQRRSAALRRSILERAFRGELVPQDPADEPASVLLERIRAERAAAGPARRRSSRRPARSGHTG